MAASPNVTGLDRAVTIALVAVIAISGWLAVTGIRRAVIRRRAWLREHGRRQP